MTGIGSSILKVAKRVARHVRAYLLNRAYRRAFRALRKARKHSYFLADLVEHRLRQGLIRPDEAMRAVRSWIRPNA